MERRFNVWVYIERDPDDGQVWQAHCLDFDIVSWGSSPSHAREMIHEAVEMCLLDDLNQGLDPKGRPKASDEDWGRLNELIRVGRPVDISSADVAEREQVSRFVVMLSFSFVPAVAASDTQVSAVPLGDLIYLTAA